MDRVCEVQQSGLYLSSCLGLGATPGQNLLTAQCRTRQSWLCRKLLSSYSGLSSNMIHDYEKSPERSPLSSDFRNKELG